MLTNFAQQRCEHAVQKMRKRLRGLFNRLRSIHALYTMMDK
jgi:hypothetical protein